MICQMCVIIIVNCFYFYAKIYSYIKNAYDSMCLRHNTNKLHQWTQNRELALNIDKCAVCRYGRNTAVKSDYYISHIKLQEVHTVKDLGVTYEEQSKFSDL